MTEYHTMVEASRTPEPPARLWILGAMLWGAVSFATAADVTVQPVAGSGFVVKDSGGATDRFRVQDNGQVSLPAVPAAPTQAQSLCIAATGLLGPCAGGGLPLSGSGIAGTLPIWTGLTALANSVITQSTFGQVGISVTGPVQNQLQVGATPGFSSNQLALGNGSQGMSFSLTPSATSWYSNANFALRSTVGDTFVGIGGVPTRNLDVLGFNAQIGLINTQNSTSATISRYSNRLEVSPVDAFQVSVGGLANPHFWIGSDGDVGIGTTSPASKLQIGSVGATGYAGNDIAFGDGTQASGIAQTASLAQWYSTTDIVLMPRGDGQGRVGINITPAYPLQVDDSVNGPFSAYAYLKVGSGAGIPVVLASGVITPHVSIWASHNVSALEFDAQSDARIKDIAGISDAARDLSTLAAIQITDYTLKDKVRIGNRPFKKVIAQQVETVYPQVVSQHVEFIPNVYRTASAVTKLANGTLLHFDNAHGLSPGAKRIKLLASGDHTMQQVGVVAIPSARDIVIDVQQLKGDKVFVYGEEVDDFRTVDYEGLTTLNISATQEIARRLAKQQADLAAVAVDKDAQVAELRGQLAKQQARVAELESLAADVSEIRAQLAALKRDAAPTLWHDASLHQ